MHENNRPEPLEDLVGDLFVDRHYELDLFWEWATGIPHPILNSIALIGRRRTGKTAILVKLFNRLFYEQESVLPVFISFAHYLHRQEPLTSYDFAREYFSGYLGSYLAFRYRQPRLLRQPADVQGLRRFAHQVQDEQAVELCEQYERAVADTRQTTHGLVQWVINLPREEARYRDMPTAMIVDEFQVLTNVHFPRQDIHHDLTDSFQWAVDTKWAPMLVSGSAVSLLVGQALGGMLSGRFSYCYLDPLAPEYAHDLVFRLGEAAGVETNEELAEAVWQLTAGFPYSIYGLLTSFSPACRDYPSLDALEEVLTFELTNIRGKLWQHYNEEFAKYDELLNTGQITKKVMFWATKYPEERIDARRVAKEIGVKVDDVQTALRKLLQADLVTKVGWTLYEGPGDPMLRRYIEYNYRQEIEELSAAEAVQDWEKEYKRLRGQMSHFVGQVAEVYVGAVLSAFDGQEVDGATYFNQPGAIRLPAFADVERRGGVVEGGVPFEIDLVGQWPLPDEAGRGAWLVQVKYTQRPVGEEEVHRFLAQTEVVVADKGYQAVTRWYFCKQGYTAGAAQLLQEAGVLYSTLEQFNALAQRVGFFGLPK